MCFFVLLGQCPCAQLPFEIRIDFVSQWIMSDYMRNPYFRFFVYDNSFICLGMKIHSSS